MIDEDSLSVVITAVKEHFQVDDPNFLEEQTRPCSIREHNSAVSTTCDGSKCISKRFPAVVSSRSRPCTVYTIVVRNHKSGTKFIVRRRYSDFYRLRKQLINHVSSGHCEHCQHYLYEIADYPFPRRRLFRSNQHNTVRDRIDSLGLFLRHLLLRILGNHFHHCQQANSFIQAHVLQSFLQIENIKQLSNPIITAPSVTPSKCSYLTNNSKAESDTQKKESITTDKAQASNTTPPSDLEISVDTCKHCMQQWTDCYCNEEGMNLMSACMRFLPFLESQNSLGKELLRQDDDSSGRE